MLEKFMFDNVWVAMLLWAASYISDYYLTIRGARLYQSVGSNYIGYEGSYELTPYYQADVNALRTVSRRFIWALWIGVLTIPILWAISVSVKLPELFSIWIGLLMLPELAVHVRHVRNLVQFTLYGEPGAIEGKITLRRWVTLRASSVEMVSFAVLWFLLFVVTGSWFFVGGTVGCLSLARSHWRMSVKAQTAVTTAPAAAK